MLLLCYNLIFIIMKKRLSILSIAFINLNMINYSFKNISDYLNDNNFLTVRSKRKFKTNDVFSLYKRGLEREGRINTSYETIIENVKFHYI